MSQFPTVDNFVKLFSNIVTKLHIKQSVTNFIALTFFCVVASFASFLHKNTNETNQRLVKNNIEISLTQSD